MLKLLACQHIRYFCLTVVLLAFLSGALRTAVPLLTVQSGYSVSGVSWAQGLFSLAWPVFGTVAGTILDRHDKVTLAVNTLLIFAVLHVALLASLMMKIVPPELVFFYAIVAGLTVVSAEAYMMTIPPLIMEGEKLTAFYSIVLFLDFGFSYFLGPVIASLVLTQSTALFLGLMITVFVALIFTVKRAIPTLPATDKPKVTVGYIITGFQFIFSNRQLTSLTALTFFLSVVFGAFLTSFIFFVTNSKHLGLHTSQYGLMFAAYALGAMTGALCVRHLLGAASVRTAVLADGLGTAALLIVPAYSNNVAAVWATTFLAGVGLSLWFISVTAFRQRLTPKDILGRANSAFRVIGYAGMPLGSFLVGVLGSLASLQFAATVIAGLLLVAMVGVLPLLWSVDRIGTPAGSTI